MCCTMMSMWAAAAAAVVVVLASSRSSSADTPAARSYDSVAPSSAQTNYIITSKPFTVRDDANAGTIKWRRDTITGASLIGASDPAKMKYSIECTDTDECAGIELGAGSSADATFKPYTQDELNRILKRYGESADQVEAESSDKILSYDDGGNQDKSKASWNLVQDPQQQQQQGPKNNPYDDRRGWVTLEPMAWSSSHIQKWEPNNRPTWPPPPQDHGPQQQQQGGYSPWASNRPVQRPSGGGNSYHLQPQQQQQHQHQQQQDWTTERPWIRPTYDYSSKPSSSQQSSNYQKPSQSYYGWNNNAAAEQDIITDGKPGQFPADVYHKPWNGDYGQTSYGGGPRPTEAEGDGQWVLLSSTKGYSIPHRPNRSLQQQRGGGGSTVTVNAVSRPLSHETASGRSASGSDGIDAAGGSRSSKRTVRLMVLPPDKDSPNVTTSHGGMIQVDVSGKSVDQEQREYAARALQKDDAENDVRPFAAAAAANDRSVKSDGDRSRAVLAAVGAGMLPAATMAMFLPMMVHRQRRDLAAATPEVVLRHLRHAYPR